MDAKERSCVAGMAGEVWSKLSPAVEAVGRGASSGGIFPPTGSMIEWRGRDRHTGLVSAWNTACCSVDREPGAKHGSKGAVSASLSH